MTTPTVRVDTYLEAGEIASVLIEEPAFCADVLAMYCHKTKGGGAEEIGPAVVATYGAANAGRVAAHLRAVADAIEAAAGKGSAAP